VVGGAWQGWTRVGTAPTVSHPGGPELLRHAYQIRLDADGRFSVLFDGNMLRGGISAGPASAWADGIGTGTLFTLSNLDDRHLSTAFDGVRAFGLTDSPNPPGGGGARAGRPGNDSAGAISPDLDRAADVGRGNGTAYFSQVTAANPAGERGPANGAPAPPRAAVSAPDAPADLSATAADGHARLPQTPSPRAARRNVPQGGRGGRETFGAGEGGKWYQKILI
jgi:hypothetical protein